MPEESRRIQRIDRNIEGKEMEQADQGLSEASRRVRKGTGDILEGLMDAEDKMECRWDLEGL